MNEIPVSVVVGTYNRLSFLKATIDTIRKELDNIDHEIIIVDGGSDDGTTKWLTEQKDIISIIQHNRGKWLGKTIERKSWGYFMNLGFRAASGKYICMLSDDCLVIQGAIKNGVRLFDRELAAGKKIGAVAFYWRNWPEQQNYWVGLTWGNKMFVNHGLYLRKGLEDVSFIDPKNYFFYHADGDLSMRLWGTGYTCIDSPDSYIEHFSEANAPVRASNLARQREDWNTYTKRWAKLGKPNKDWIEKSFVDKQNTAGKYWTGVRVRVLRRFGK